MERLVFLETLTLRPMSRDEYGNLSMGKGSLVSINKTSLKWSQRSVDALRVICEETGAKIVITDKSKKFYSIADYEEMFKLYGWDNAPIRGRTLSKRGDGFVKSEEIGEYIYDVYTTDYVILDIVEPRMFEPELKIALLRVPYETGLTEHNIEEAIMIMAY